MELGICPDNLFPDKYHPCIFKNFPKQVGITPVKKASSMPKLIKLIRFCNAARIKPDIWLPPKYNKWSCVDKLPMELGKTPSNWFIADVSDSILLQFVKDIKKFKSLSNLFLLRCSNLRSSKNPKLVGTWKFTWCVKHWWMFRPPILN